MKQFLFSESHLRAIIAESIKEVQSISMDVQRWGCDLIDKINKEIFKQPPIIGRNRDKVYVLIFNFSVPNKPNLKVNAVVHDFKNKKDLTSYLSKTGEPICSYERDGLKRHSINIKLLSVNRNIDAVNLNNSIFHELQHFNQFSSGMEGSYFKGNLMTGAVYEINRWPKLDNKEKSDFANNLKYHVALMIYYSNTMEQSAFLQTAFVQIKKEFPQNFTDAVNFARKYGSKYSLKSAETILFEFIKNKLLSKTEFYTVSSSLSKLLKILLPYKKKIDEVLASKEFGNTKANSEWLFNYGRNALNRSQKNSERMIVLLITQIKKTPEWKEFVIELNRLSEIPLT